MAIQTVGLSIPTLPPGVGGAVILALAIIVLAAPLAWFLWWQITYKNRVLIEEVRDGKTYSRQDKYRYKKENDTECIKLWKTKALLPKPEMDYIRRVGNKDVIELYRKENGQYYPRKIIRQGENYINVIANRDAEFWASMRTQKALVKWDRKSWIEMYAAPMSVFMVAFVFILGMWVFWSGMQDALGPMNQASGSLRIAAASLEHAINASCSTGGITIT